MVITFSNIKGSAGGGGATGGTVSGITLWSDETTKAYIDDALSGVTDVLSAYTKTEDFATINGSAITSGGNLVIEATPYSGGTNIDITDHVISVTGITLPTKVSELVNDSGYITTADTQNFVTSGDVQTQINDSISGKADSSAVTAQISEVKQEIEAKIPSKVSDLQNDLNFASTGDVESMISGFTTSGDVKTQIESYNYINSGQAQTQIDNSISGKLDTDVFTAYTANTKTELNNKQDISGMTAYATTAFTESTYAKIDDIPTKTSDLTNDSGFITDAALLGYATEQYVDNSVSGKVDNSALTQYYTSAQTDTAIQNATNGLASEAWVNNQGFLKEHQSLSAYSTTEQMNQAIGSATAATIGWVESQGYLKEHQSLSAYTPTSGFSTINGSAITEGGNIVVEETPYSGGANIDITDHIISVTGITVPTKLSELTNDEGFINSSQAQTQIDNAVNGKQDTLVSGENIKTINNQSLLGSGNIEIQGGGETYSAGEGIGINADNIISVTGNYETVVELTQAEYDALTSYDKNTTYVITDAPAVNLSAYTPTSGFSTINGNVITDGGNIVIEGGNTYTAGANIDISTDNVISVTGITVPTSNTAFTNDAGYVTSGEVETQITGKNYATESWVQDNVNLAIESETARTESTYAKIGDIPSLDGYATTGWVESQGYLTEHQDISGKLDTDIFTAYTANTQTELNNKQDASGMTAYATTAFTESTYLKEHQSLSAYSTTEQVQTLINTAKQEVENEIPDVSNFVTSAQVNTQIESKGYITGYTETDPVFMASPVSGISAQDITNWNNKLDSSALTPYYTSAQTDNAISNAVSGKVDSSRVDEIEEVTASALVELHNTKQDILVSGTNIKTINNQSLLGSGNIEIQGGGGSYTAGANIDITNNVISVTGITIPTSNTAFTNDAGYVNSGEVETQITSKGYITDAALNGYATTAFTEQTYLKEHQSLSAYTPTSGFSTINGNVITDGGNLVIEETPYSAGTNIDITDHIISVTGITIPKKLSELTNDEGFVTSAQVETQITNKGYITGYTENDPVFQASAASGISAQDITNWNAKLDSSALNPYYTSAQTNTAINNAVSGKTDKVSVTASGSGYKFPTWNNQGCITGTSANAYQALQNINGSNRTVYSDSSEALPTIYAPASEGLAGQPLLSNGSGAPVWGAYKFQFISQSQYDALATKDSTTIYFIVNEN